LACCPATTLSLCCFMHVTESSCWEFGSLPHPSYLGRFSVSPLPLLSVLDYSSLFVFFSFAGGFQSA
jgi:hypothetical protein